MSNKLMRDHHSLTS